MHDSELAVRALLWPVWIENRKSRATCTLRCEPIQRGSALDFQHGTPDIDRKGCWIPRSGSGAIERPASGP